MTRSVLLAAWALIAAAFMGCEVLALVSRGRYSGLQGVMDHLGKTSPRLVAVFVGWMWVGWHFFAR